MPKATARHDPQRELPRELPAAFQSSQKASSTTTAGVKHSFPLHFRTPRNRYLPNNKDPRLERQRPSKKPCAASEAPKLARTRPEMSSPREPRKPKLRKITGPADRRHAKIVIWPPPLLPDAGFGGTRRGQKRHLEPAPRGA